MKYSGHKKLKDNTVLYGLHACKAALNNKDRQVTMIWAEDDFLTKNPDFKPLLDTHGAKLKTLSKHDFDKILDNKNAVHQGIALDVAPLPSYLLDRFLKENLQQGPHIFVMLDQVTDPHNIGAIVRSACAFGASGVIVQDKNTPPITGTLAKVACGAIEHIPIIRETNLARALEMLKKNDIWCIGLDEGGEQTLAQSVQSLDSVCLVLGAEGAGLRRNIADHCDLLARLPMHNAAVPSINVSNAAATALYEMVRV